jgi:glutamyl-tRNA reductase
MSIFCFGLSHRTAAVDVRERFAIPLSALPEALAQLKTIPGVTEGVIVSTCNRTEFYVTGELADTSAPAFFGNFYRDFRAVDEKHLFRRHRPLFMIDLAMPRDIDPAVQKLDGVYLYDLDSLQSIAERTLESRKQESEKCYQLIERHVQEFQSWMEHSQTFNFPSIVAVVGRSQTDCS